MRAYLFPLLFLAPLLIVPAVPYVGVLLWAWVTLMNPHQIAGGWISTFPINQVVVGLLGCSLLLHREPLQPFVDGLTTVIILFMGWTVVTTLTALSPEISAARADLSLKSMLFGLVVAITTTNRVRFRALLWIYVISLGYFGAKGGMFTIVTGGAGNVVGPPNSTIEDRNTLALALLTTIPLAYYLYATAANRWVRIGLVALIILNAVAVLGTYSRGGTIGLAFLACYFWLKSTQKVVIAVAAIAIGLVGWSVLPDRWFERIASVREAEADASFQGRQDAWQFAINAASDRLLGVGFSGTEDLIVFQLHMPEAVATVDRGRAAHSIYFQVLGDHGFIGLGLYLTILVLAWRAAGRLAKTRSVDGEWAANFGKMGRVALGTYCVSGAALSMAYDSTLFSLLGLLSAGSRLAAEKAAAKPGRSHARPAARLALQR